MTCIDTCCGHEQLHHLAGIGNLLGGVVQGPLTFNSYLEIRQTLYVALRFTPHFLTPYGQTIPGGTPRKSRSQPGPFRRHK